MSSKAWKLIGGALTLATLCMVLAFTLFRGAPPPVPTLAPVTPAPIVTAKPAPSANPASGKSSAPRAVAGGTVPHTPVRIATREGARTVLLAARAPHRAPSRGLTLVHARMRAYHRTRMRLAFRQERHGRAHHPRAAPSTERVAVSPEGGSPVAVAAGDDSGGNSRPADTSGISAEPAVAAPSGASVPVPAADAVADAGTPAPPVADALISPQAAPATGLAPARAINLSAGSGRLIRLPGRMTHVFVADDKIADVRVNGPNALYLFAKLTGHTTVYATDKAGAVIWASDVRVGANLADVAAMLRVAMPEAQVTARPLSGMLLLTGTVLSPADVADAQRIVEQATAGTVQVLNGLKVATPQQVSLHVKIAEVNRNVARAIGLNYKTADNTGGFGFGLAQGRAGAISDDLKTFTASGVGTTLALGGKLLGLDIRQAIDLAETDGFASTLAEPNLTALSGETASFLAGGEIPIPQSQGLGAVSVEFKQYGVSLAFTPTVMSGGRIAIRVRPEVSQLSDVGSVKANGFTIPSLITRRAETTVELGSGQSFAIGGLLQNTHNNSFDKAPLLGDLPIIGALFRSNSFQKQETELVIVVTPYIVKPVDANQIALPADGYRSPPTAERVLLGKSYDGSSVFALTPAAVSEATAPVAVSEPIDQFVQ